jgi:hypothetical protein
MATDPTWYYSNDGEQLGPVSVEELQQLAGQGIITTESSLWAEGLEDWVRATQVEGLFGEEAPQEVPVAAAPATSKLIVGAAAQTAAPLAGQVTPVTTTAPAAQAVAPAASPYLAGPSTVPVGEDYPAIAPKKAGYGKLVAFTLGGPLIMLLVLLIVGVAGNQSATSGTMSDSAAMSFGLLAIGGYFLWVILSIVGMALAMTYLYRAWSLLHWGSPTTTPGKAVGFLFIPFFNLYWIFIAYHGLAKDWNRVMASHPDLALAPRMKEGMFLTYCICVVSGVGAIFAPIIWFFMFADICKGINFMASRAMITSKPAGMSFY